MSLPRALPTNANREGKAKWKRRVRRGPHGWIRDFSKVRTAIRTPVRREASVAKASPVTSATIVYGDLKRPAYPDGECYRCGEFPNKTTSVMTADAGMKPVVECSRCHTIMRPYHS